MSKLLPLFLIILTLILVVIGACTSNEEPIKVGFLGVLTGRSSPLGISGRNATELAVEKINSTGGIHGHKVELVVKDNGMEEDRLKKAIDEFERAGVKAVVGPMTSSMGIAAMAQESPLTFVSPTVSTTRLSKRDDLFFRLHTDISFLAKELTNRICKSEELKRFVIIRDDDNYPYVSSFSTTFSDGMVSCGKEVVETINFNSKQKPIFKKLTSKLIDTPHEGVLILANAYDTALLSQHLRNQGLSQPVFCSEWSTGDALIRMGGKAVEGLSWMQCFPYNKESEAYKEFSRLYINRYGDKPDFAAAYAFEASMTLFHALNKAPVDTSPKEALRMLGPVTILFDEIRLDEFGDVVRPSYFSTVANGAFASLGN